MTYQGHHSDGSSIQKHSTGSHYPFVVGKQEGQRRPWFVMAPSGKIIDRQVECAVAYENAEHCAKLHRERQARIASMLSKPVYVAATGQSISLPLNVTEQQAVRNISP